MNRTRTHQLLLALVVSCTAILTACADGSLAGPNRLAPTDTPTADRGDGRTVDLGSCDSLAAPEGNHLVFHAFAAGVQIYRWNGASWVFVEPSATLFANAGENGVVATHFAGPTWMSNSGSEVVGAVMRKCPGSPNAIPWLLLSAASTEGPGIFQHVTFIQRVNTVGGNAPTAPGTVLGETRAVEYKAEYNFYKP